MAFPDPTDIRLPPAGDPSWGLASKIREFARGRPVVSLVGHLQRTKGLEEFTRAAKDESLRDVVFFLGGEVNWGEIDNRVREELLSIWEQSPNILTHLQRIKDEQTLNAVIAQSSVVYAAYTDFPNSSGILTKAAAFERPLIVSDGYLMAERTRAYRLGEVVKEGNMEQIKAALRRLCDVGPNEASGRQSRCAEYRAAHSYDGLKAGFSELLGRSSTNGVP